MKYFSRSNILVPGLIVLVGILVATHIVFEDKITSFGNEVTSAIFDSVDSESMEVVIENIDNPKYTDDGFLIFKGYVRNYPITLWPFGGKEINIIPGFSAGLGKSQKRFLKSGSVNFLGQWSAPIYHSLLFRSGNPEFEFRHKNLLVSTSTPIDRSLAERDSEGWGDRGLLRVSWHTDPVSSKFDISPGNENTRFNKLINFLIKNAGLLEYGLVTEGEFVGSSVVRLNTEHTRSYPNWSLFILDMENQKLISPYRYSDPGYLLKTIEDVLQAEGEYSLRDEVVTFFTTRTDLIIEGIELPDLVNLKSGDRLVMNSGFGLNQWARESILKYSIPFGKLETKEGDFFNEVFISRVYGDDVYLKREDGALVSFKYVPSFFDIDSDIPHITWNDGTQNNDRYKLGITSCIYAVGRWPHGFLFRDEMDFESSDFKVIGEGRGGSKIYALAKDDHQIYKDLYNFYQDWTYDPSKYTYEDLTAEGSVIFWEAANGSVVQTIKTDLLLSCV